MAGDRAWQKCVIQSRLMKKRSIIWVHRLQGWHTGAHKTASPLAQWERTVHFLLHNDPKTSALLMIMQTTLFCDSGLIKVASLAHSRAAEFWVLYIPEEKEGGVGKTLRLQSLSGSADFGFMFDSTYSLHLCKGQNLRGKFTNEESGTWSTAVSGRLVNLNCSHWCILYPE